jgi:hypothetical protein
LVGEAIAVTLRTADIGVGHLTRTAARDLARDLTKVALACQQVLVLVNRHLYVALKEEPMSFDGPHATRYIREAAPR